MSLLPSRDSYQQCLAIVLLIPQEIKVADDRKGLVEWETVISCIICVVRKFRVVSKLVYKENRCDSLDRVSFANL